MSSERTPDTERIIGMLQEHREVTKAWMTRMENKVDALQEFRWKWLGVMMLLTAIISLAGEMLMAGGR